MRSQKMSETRVAAPVARRLLHALAWSALAAAGFAALWVLLNWSGARGRYATSGTPISFLHAWEDVQMFAGIVFVASWVVLSVWFVVRKPTG